MVTINGFENNWSSILKYSFLLGTPTPRLDDNIRSQAITTYKEQR